MVFRFRTILNYLYRPTKIQAPFICLLVLLCLNCSSEEERAELGQLSMDLNVPVIEVGPANPGKRVKQTLPVYSETEVYHLLYLPTNWEAGKKYPVIVEYPGNGPWSNDIGDVSTGKVDGCNLGYGIGGGRDYIWISMPFISENGLQNQDWWWGDIEATKQYCMKTVELVCEKYGGDEQSVILAGFSRGAIAANYIGLHDDEIANIWQAFIANSHYDGLRKWDYPESDPESALKRLQRLKGRPQFICQEGKGTAETKAYLSNMGIEGDFTFMDISFRNHTNTWILYNIPERKVIREWLTKATEL